MTGTPGSVALTDYLAQLDRDGAVALVERSRAQGATVEELILDLLTPALVEVGRRWAAGEAGAATAQAAAGIVRTLLPRCPLPEAPAGRLPVAVCAPDDELHDLPGEMVTELLRAAGWPAQFIGTGVTARQLPSFLASRRPSALLLSCSTPCGLPGAARAIQVAHGLAVPVMVGGAAFGADSMLAVRLGAAAWAPTAHHAAAVLEAWSQAPPAIAPGRPLTDDYLRFERSWAEIKRGAIEAVHKETQVEYADPAGMHLTKDRVELVLRYLGAALLVDDGRLFHDFLSWRSAYYRARDISPERLISGLTAIASVIPADAERARAFLADGIQQLTWSNRSGAVKCPRPVPASVTAPGPGPTGEATAAPATMASDLMYLRSAGAGGPGEQSAPTGSGSAEQPGRVFTDLLFVAATTCRCPWALISAPGPDGRWRTLSHGTERRELLVDDDLLTEIGRSRDPLEITDLALRAGGSELARGPLGIRFVYGVAMRNRQSTLLGVFCVLDRRPRELSKRERDAVAAVARQVGGQLAAWRRSPTASGGRQSTPGGIGAHEPSAAEFGAEGPARRPSESGGGDPELLRSHEVAVLFDVTERTVINWAAANRLPAIRTAGGHLRFRADDVLALLAGRDGSKRLSSAV